ncbi:hypothetical protein [Microvirga antarctica]|uniref:hypothetical protein n=1 Tax=Microvirga antarctica TaxID=2819233 RepID=UPI001B30B3B6|nr:hypothetical protein [Microvirga antarctica]
MTVQIARTIVDALAFDIAAAVADFTQAVDDHRLTLDVPAPVAHPLVELIVRHHEGHFEIIEDPESQPLEVEPPAPSRTLPFDVFVSRIDGSAQLALVGLTMTDPGSKLWYDLGLSRNGFSLDDTRTIAVLDRLVADDVLSSDKRDALLANAPVS